MTTDVRTVPAYTAGHVAARIMRHRRIHHVLVTHEKKVVGLIGSFDLLKLVEDHHFVAKRAAPAPRRPVAQQDMRGGVAWVPRLVHPSEMLDEDGSRSRRPAPYVDFITIDARRESF